MVVYSGENAQRCLLSLAGMKGLNELVQSPSTRFDATSHKGRETNVEEGLGCGDRPDPGCSSDHDHVATSANSCRRLMSISCVCGPPPPYKAQWLSGSCPAAAPQWGQTCLHPWALIWIPSLQCRSHHAVRRHNGTNNVAVSPRLLTNGGALASWTTWLLIEGLVRDGAV